MLDSLVAYRCVPAGLLARVTFSFAIGSPHFKSQHLVTFSRPGLISLYDVKLMSLNSYLSKGYKIILIIDELSGRGRTEEKAKLSKLYRIGWQLTLYLSCASGIGQAHARILAPQLYMLLQSNTDRIPSHPYYSHHAPTLPVPKVHEDRSDLHKALLVLQW